MTLALTLTLTQTLTLPPPLTRRGLACEHGECGRLALQPERPALQPELQPERAGGRVSSGRHAPPQRPGGVPSGRLRGRLCAKAEERLQRLRLLARLRKVRVLGRGLG